MASFFARRPKLVWGMCGLGSYFGGAYRTQLDYNKTYETNIQERYEEIVKLKNENKTEEDISAAAYMLTDRTKPYFNRSKDELEGVPAAFFKIFMISCKTLYRYYTLQPDKANLNDDQNLSAIDRQKQIDRLQKLSIKIIEPKNSQTPKDELLFIHGFPDKGELWDKQVEFFSNKGYRCLIVTLPGFGDRAANALVNKYWGFDFPEVVT